MWGNILTEISYLNNFNMTFSNHKSDVLIHLTQWQYWWWFWFTFLWALYYLLTARIVRYRTLKFNPKIATTLRPHGKWGDLLTCIIPITWCMNILLNSNFVLKLIEWQSESSLFTLRIRGKQWYWVYKFDLKNITDIFSTPKNLGRNKWFFSVFGDIQSSEDYLHILQLRSQNRWVKKYWNDLLDKTNKSKDFHLISPQETYKVDFFKNKTLTKLNSLVEFNTKIPNNKNYLVSDLVTNNQYNGYFSDSLSIDLSRYYGVSKIVQSTNSSKLFTQQTVGLFNNDISTNQRIFNFFSADINQVDTAKFYVVNHSDIGDETRILKKSTGRTQPVRCIKYPIQDNNNPTELIRFRFGSSESNIRHKPISNSTFLTLKQKRYNVRNKISTLKFASNVDGKKYQYSGNPFLKNTAIIEENFSNPTRQYRMLKKAKNRLDATSINTWNRLLRAKRVLVLPAHVNITAITNSYDIIHSWHVPGLGLKMDCLPGRATHHTFYIDNVGLYFGQCAEICGRYHHHMPIRVCALPFEHFLVWWYSFGLPRLLFLNEKDYKNYSFRKFSW